MSKQRFIHPELWDDPVLGSLPEREMLLYIGCFSLADDEGRLPGEPAWLRGHVFPYREYSLDQIRDMRDHVCAECTGFHVYKAQGKEYVAFLNWTDFQAPKYVKPSKIPAPYIPEIPLVLEVPGQNVPESGTNPDQTRATGSNSSSDLAVIEQGRKADAADAAETAPTKSIFKEPTLKRIA